MPRSSMLVLLPVGVALFVGCGRASVSGLGDPTPTEKTGDRDGGVEVVVRDGGPGSTPDAGFPPNFDAGPPRDAGGPLRDAGRDRDAGIPDSGDPRDAGTPRDAGPPRDAGFPRDGGPPRDAGTPDGGVECLVNGDCTGIGPNDYCDVGTFTCVECLNNQHCNFGGVCDVTSHVCRNPCFNGQCLPGQVCDPAINGCVDCLTNADCPNNEVCDPTIRECVQCGTNADCALVPSRPFCNGSNECVGCLSNADCSGGEECFDYADGFCAPQNGRAICTPCLTDGECGAAGDLCIGYANAGGFIDRSCSPACTMESDCPRGWDCVSVRGGGGRVCRPRYEMQSPTCTAERNLGEACRLDPTDVDPDCGITGLQDARCVAFGPPGAAVCSIWCDTNDQCPTGTTCQMTSTGNVGTCL